MNTEVMRMTQTKVVVPPPISGIDGCYRIRTTSLVYNATGNTSQIPLPTFASVFKKSDLKFNQEYDAVYAMNGDGQANGSHPISCTYRNGNLYADMDTGVVGAIRLNLLYVKIWSWNW